MMISRYKPTPRESAILLLTLFQARERELNRRLGRVRLGEITLRRLWNRQVLSEDFVDEVKAWLLEGGWVLFKSTSTYAAVMVDVVDSWPAISSKRLESEIAKLAAGKLNFDELERDLKSANSSKDDEWKI